MRRRTTLAVDKTPWIECGLPFGPCYGKLPEMARLDSFVNRELNRPGTEVEMEDGSRHLIGTVNEIAGTCNDCPAFGKALVVKRYRVLVLYR